MVVPSRAKLQTTHVNRVYYKQYGGTEIFRHASKVAYNSRAYVEEISLDFEEDRLFR